MVVVAFAKILLSACWFRGSNLKRWQAEESPRQLKARIFSGGSNKIEMSFFQGCKKSILMDFGQSMDFIYKQQSPYLPGSDSVPIGQ